MSSSKSMTSSDDESYDESISWPEVEEGDKSTFRVRVIDVDGGTHEEQQHITYF